MPSVLANTSTDPSQKHTLFFQKRKISDFAGPMGDTPKVTSRKSCLAPAEKRPIGFPNRSSNRTRRRPKAVPEYCWIFRLVSGMAWKRGTSVFPIALPTVLGDVLIMGCFPVDFQEVKRPLRAKSGKRPIKGGKRPMKEGKRAIKAMVLVGISVGCLMGCFSAPPPWRKTAPLKRPIKGSMSKSWLFWLSFGRKRSHHVMGFSC